MAMCIKCGEEFSEKRKELGYNICLYCGEVEAKESKFKKSEKVVVAYNKGPLIYVPTVEEFKNLGK